ncbi:membrane protein [Pseudovibrio japonicus]|uniref:Membrane protein n=1 Tax=Pseudovibrio japonicus TaxID=366534 RepID=A0ABQ3ER38_9HYPH|nr:four-carbon acid sugar kinase family protein [Pseudovibrio japonicus]GHB46658.1 membrane protein [Pseudovibrio japonicus]
MPKLLVVADDFTGSNDTGVQFANKGASVEVKLSDQAVNCDVTVINTESRALTANEAASRVRSAIKDNVDGDTQVIFKKIDSTFRGNIGAELESAVNAFGAKLAIVVAAIPESGRLTKNGVCYVNGTPVSETEFARDPKTPVSHSSIAEIISLQTNLPCEIVPVEQVRSHTLNSLIKQHIGELAPSILILDVLAEQDLSTIADALTDLNEKFVLVGAAGIAKHLPSSMFSEGVGKPVLVLAGSMSETTFNQINYCRSLGLKTVYVSARDIWLNFEDTLRDAVDKISWQLQQGNNCALMTLQDQGERQKVLELCAAEDVNLSQISTSVARFFGQAGKELFTKFHLAGALLTGGDIAASVAAGLGASGYKIQGEIEPCIPYGHFTDNKTRIVTKAGGFGSEESIQNIIEFLEGPQCNQSE